MSDVAVTEPPVGKAVAAGRPRVLVVDDERAILTAVRKILSSDRYEVLTLDGPLGALDLVREQEIDVVLVDQRMPHMSGIDVLKRVKELRPDVEVVMMTAYATVESAIAAVRAGAFDYITKPFDNIDKVCLVVEKALEKKSLVDRTRTLERKLASSTGIASIVGTSPQMADVYRLVDSVAPTSANVLVQGETGTGKELVANAIHERSARAHEKMVTVNCSALTETLLESELFGHMRGSFTGATTNKKGLFEAAHRGTLFLDEVGDMSLATQVKVLRSIQSGEVRPIGSNDVLKTDVRIIAATNVDLEEAMRKGTFREDLYWRLNVIQIRVPPLRQRAGDIPMLVAYFLRRASARFNKKVTSVSPAAMDRLLSHRWDGNVRELENVVERAVVLVQGEVITDENLPDHLRNAASKTTTRVVEPEMSPLLGMRFAEAKDAAIGAFERRYLEELMRQSEGNISDAARRAGLDRSNFRRLLGKHGIAPDGFK